MLEILRAYLGWLVCAIVSDHAWTRVLRVTPTYGTRTVYQCARCGAES